MARVIKEARDITNLMNAKESSTQQENQPKKRKKTSSTKQAAKKSTTDVDEINESFRTDLNETTNLDETYVSEHSQSILSIEPSTKRSKTVVSPVKQTAADPNKSSQIPQKTTDSLAQSITSSNIINFLTSKQPQQSIIIDSSGRVIHANFQSLFSSTPTLPSLQYLPIAPPQQQQQHQQQHNQQQFQQPNSNLVLPASFNGTILYHPTIHIHTGSGKSQIEIQKYKKLAPKK